MRQNSENRYIGVFGGEELIANGFKILGAPENAATDGEVDNAKEEKNEDALIDFRYVH